MDWFMAMREKVWSKWSVDSKQLSGCLILGNYLFARSNTTYLGQLTLPGYLCCMN